MRLIDADKLYKAMQDAEELARKRVLDTESTMPYPNNLNPSYTRYVAQMDERTRAKEMIADAPTVDAVKVVRCINCRLFQEDKFDKFGFCSLFRDGRNDDDFCSKAVRK